MEDVLSRVVDNYAAVIDDIKKAWAGEEEHESCRPYILRLMVRSKSYSETELLMMQWQNL